MEAETGDVTAAYRLAGVGGAKRKCRIREEQSVALELSLHVILVRNWERMVAELEQGVMAS